MSTVDDLMTLAFHSVCGPDELRSAIESALRAEYERGRGESVDEQLARIMRRTDGRADRLGLPGRSEHERGEPVAYFCPVGCGCLWRDNKDGSMSLFNGKHRSCEFCENTPLDQLVPLYASPPKREPLSDAQIILIFESCSVQEDQTLPGWGMRLRIKWARAIERAHGIGDE